MKILILLLFCFNTIACDYPQKLKKDEIHTARCKAVILNEDQFINASNAKKDLSLLKIKVQELEGLDKVRVSQLEIARESEKSAHKQLRWEKTKGTFMNIGAFILGSLITGYIAKETLK